MKNIILASITTMFIYQANAQKTIPDSTNVNTIFRNTLYTSKIGQAQVGGYAQIDYNQEIDGPTRNNGKLDVHRLIIFLGHKFSDKTSFFTEIEVEHVKEIYVEQAFLEHKIADWVNFRGGLLLVPMSIINEYHEPPTFNGVERPNLNKYITPTTWREMGAGFSGTVQSSSLNYQLYVMNGFSSYAGGVGLLRGSDGLRKGRQKGAESYLSANPNLTGKINYYGLPNLNIGLGAYYGKTQSELYDGIRKDDVAQLQLADSSVVGISMFEFDYRFKKGPFTSRGEVIYSLISNTEQYNEFTRKYDANADAFTNNNLGSSMFGYYFEFGYDLLDNFTDIKDNLYIFSRYEQYYTHNTTDQITSINKSYNRRDIVTGLHYRPSDRASFKADFQLTDNQNKPGEFTKIVNFGVGAWF